MHNFTQGATASNPLSNTATLCGKFSACGRTNSESVEKVSNVTLDFVRTTLTKTADKCFVRPSEKITYFITVTNTGTKELFNVKIKDAISEKLQLLPHTICPTPLCGECLLRGISMGNLAPKESKTLSFSAIVCSDARGDIINSSIAEFNFYDDCSKLQCGKSSPAEEVTPIIFCDLAFNKSAIYDDSALPTNEVRFNIIAKNIGDCEINELQLSDVMGEGLEYVANSTVINGNEPIDLNPCSGITVGTLAPDEIFSLSYVAKMLI